MILLDFSCNDFKISVLGSPKFERPSPKIINVVFLSISFSIKPSKSLND